MIDGVYTFGAPRVLDPTAAKRVREVLLPSARCPILRLVNGGDLVSAIPPKQLGELRYDHAAHAVVLITEDGELVFDPTAWRRVRDALWGAFKDLGELGLDAWKDHRGRDYEICLTTELRRRERELETLHLPTGVAGVELDLRLAVLLAGLAAWAYASPAAEDLEVLGWDGAFVDDELGTEALIVGAKLYPDGPYARVVAFRGTKGWSDVCADADVSQVPFCGGLAHCGMLRGTRSLAPRIDEVLGEMPPGLTFATGHSKGGGHALLWAAEQAPEGGPCA